MRTPVESESVRGQEALENLGDQRRRRGQPAVTQRDTCTVTRPVSDQERTLEQIRAKMNYGSVLQQSAGQVCL